MSLNQTNNQTNNQSSGKISAKFSGAALTVFAVAASAHAAPEFFTAPAPAPVASTISAAPIVTPVSTSKDWRLLDLGTSCVAETVTAVDGINHHLELRVQKTPSSPLEIAIRSETVSSATAGFKATLDRSKTKTYSFAKTSGDGVSETFWNIPRGSDELVAYLKREMKLDAQGFDVGGAPMSLVSFSLRGSSVTINELGKKCATGLAVPTPADMAFEKAFLPQAVATVDLGRLSPGRTDHLREILKAGREAFLSSKVTQGEIEALNAKYLREINELSGLRSNLDRLTQREIVRLEQARKTAQDSIAQAETDLLNLKPQTATIEASLISANADYEAAYNAVKPLLPEYNRLVGAIRTAETRATDAQSRVATVQANLDRASQALRSLQAESGQLRLQYSDAQTAARNARDELQRAGREANDFNEQAELRQRLSSDSRISRLQSEVRNIETRINAQEQAVQRQEMERNRLNSELASCTAVPGRDCQMERQRLTEAQQRFQELRRALQALESSRESTRNEIQNVRRQIEDEVRQIKAQLDGREAQARSRTQQAELNLRNIEDRLRSVEQIDIPARENDVRRLNSDLTVAGDDVTAANRRVRTARTDLANYRQSTGFDSLQANVDTKLARVNALKADLVRVDREIKKREKAVVDGQKALAQVAIDMEKTLTQIKLKEARSTEVQRALEPYELAKADLMSKKAVSDQAFAAAQSEFAVNL